MMLQLCWRTFVMLQMFRVANSQTPQQKIFVQIVSLYGSWIHYEEGPWFPATMEQCIQQASTNLSDGISYAPMPHPNERLSLKSVHNRQGECSLLTYGTGWTYNHGREKWSYKNIYSHVDDLKCPAQRDPTFKGIEVGYNDLANVNKVKIQKKTNISKFCFLDSDSVPAPAQCAILPVQIINGMHLQISNVSGQEPPRGDFYCSSLFDACAANLSLYERKTDLGECS